MTDTNKALLLHQIAKDIFKQKHDCTIGGFWVVTDEADLPLAYIPNLLHAELFRDALNTRALSPNAVVIPRDEFEKFKILAECITNIFDCDQDAHEDGSYCQACVVEEFIAILSQYGEQK
jgi:hypothetical protein